MTVEQLKTLIQAENLTALPLTGEVKTGYACDLLSWVMSKGEEQMAWVTVQTHMNVIAVAVLLEMACVILPENIQMEEGSLKKAEEENMPVLKSPLSAFKICALMAQNGVEDKA